MPPEYGTQDLVIEVHCGLSHDWPPEPVLQFPMKSGPARATFDEAKAEYGMPLHKADGEVFLVSSTAVIDSFPASEDGLHDLISKLQA